MSIVKRKLVLHGHHKGKDVTFTVGGQEIEFEKGKVTLEGPEPEVEGMARYLRKCYQALPEGEDLKVEEPEPATPPMDPLGDEQIKAALAELDHEDDEHWTNDGKPAMKAVEAILGRTDITRAQVTAADPELRRDNG